MGDEIRSIQIDEVMTAVNKGVLRALAEQRYLLDEPLIDRIVITTGGMVALERAGRELQMGGGLSRQTLASESAE